MKESDTRLWPSPIEEKWIRQKTEKNEKKVLLHVDRLDTLWSFENREGEKRRGPIHPSVCSLHSALPLALAI